MPEVPRTPITRPLYHDRDRARRAGITVVETLWVVALIGILAAIAIPSIARSTAPHRVIREARSVHAALVEARTLATVERRDYRFVLAGGAYGIEVQGDSGWSAHRPARAAAAGISISIDGATAGTIVFNPRGWADSPSSIVVDDSNVVEEIDVLASGMVRWSGGAP